MKYANVSYTLRELRESKGIKQKHLAELLKISQSLYASIEAGTRKPSIDTCFILASLYGTSMDFIYHSFYRQHVVFYMPDHDLNYAMRKAKALDMRYIRDNFKKPFKMPELPAAVQFGSDDGVAVGGEQPPPVVAFANQD